MLQYDSRTTYFIISDNMKLLDKMIMVWWPTQEPKSDRLLQDCKNDQVPLFEYCSCVKIVDLYREYFKKNLGQRSRSMIPFETAFQVNDSGQRNDR